MSESTGGPRDQSAAPSLVWIPVGRIRAYERNPRQSENPAYGGIKASIHVDGMLQPLIVTRRLSDEDYVVAAGGNTRLVHRSCAVRSGVAGPDS